MGSVCGTGCYSMHGLSVWYTVLCNICRNKLRLQICPPPHTYTYTKTHAHTHTHTHTHTRGLTCVGPTPNGTSAVTSLPFPPLLSSLYSLSLFSLPLLSLPLFSLSLSPLLSLPLFSLPLS